LVFWVLLMKQAREQERIKVDVPEANLWRAVIGQAIDDLSQPVLRLAAMDWLGSTAHGPGSFRWACDHLDLDPEAVSAALNKANDWEKSRSTFGGESTRRRPLVLIRVNG
jgi:hypothetical protein